jgi:hypothetical protein
MRVGARFDREIGSDGSGRALAAILAFLGREA